MEDISERQKKEAGQDRVDYEELIKRGKADDINYEEDNGDTIQDVRGRRRRNREQKNTNITNVVDDQIEDDDDFRMNLDKADK